MNKKISYWRFQFFIFLIRQIGNTNKSYKQKFVHIFLERGDRDKLKKEKSGAIGWSIK